MSKSTMKVAPRERGRRTRLATAAMAMPDETTSALVPETIRRRSSRIAVLNSACKDSSDNSIFTQHRPAFTTIGLTPAIAVPDEIASTSTIERVVTIERIVNNKRARGACSPSSKQGKPRRSKRIKGLQDERMKQKGISAITPSPAILQNGTRTCASDLNVGNDMHIHLDMAQESQTSSVRNKGDETSLPPGVHSMICPYMQNHRQLCQVRSTSAPNSVPARSEYPCGCIFQFNDSSSVINIESYLAAYNTEYIQSLYDDELNIRHVTNDFYPQHLQSPSKKRAGDQTQKRRSPRLLNLETKRESCSDFFSPDCTNSEMSIPSTFSPTSLSSSSQSSTSTSTMDSRTLSQKKYEYYMDYASHQENITPYMRAVLIDWLIEVAEEFKIAPIALHTAVGLVDRCLGCCVIAKNAVWESIGSMSSSSGYSSSSSNDEDSSDGKTLVVDRKTLQLLGCGCMMIACKMHEISPPDATDFCFISASTYNKSQIIDMEQKICALLAFNLHIITPHHFANIYLRAHHVSGNGTERTVCSITYDDTMKYLVDYLLEIASLKYSFAKEPPSKVAAAAVYLARATLGIRDASAEDTPVGDSKHNSKGFFSRTLKYYSGYGEMDLEDLVFDLHAAHVKSEDESLHSVYDKYSKKFFNMVALRVPVEEEVLYEAFN